MCIWYGKVVGRLIVQKKKLRPKAKASCLHVVVQPSHVKFCGSLLPHLREKGCQLVTWNSYEYHYTECPYRNVQCANRFVSMCAIVHICSLVYVCGMYIYIYVYMIIYVHYIEWWQHLPLERHSLETLFPLCPNDRVRHSSLFWRNGLSTPTLLWLLPSGKLR